MTPERPGTQKNNNNDMSYFPIESWLFFVGILSHNLKVALKPEEVTGHCGKKH